MHLPNKFCLSKTNFSCFSNFEPDRLSCRVFQYTVQIPYFCTSPTRIKSRNKYLMTFVSWKSYKVPRQIEREKRSERDEERVVKETGVSLEASFQNHNKQSKIPFPYSEFVIRDLRRGLIKPC